MITISITIFWITSANLSAYGTVVDGYIVAVSVTAGAKVAMWIAAKNIGCRAVINNYMVAVSVAAGGIVNSWIAAVDIFAYSRIINSYIIVCNIYLTIGITTVNITCYFSIAIDVYIAAADIATIISFANTENIAYCTAGNGYRYTVA